MKCVQGLDAGHVAVPFFLDIFHTNVLFAAKLEGPQIAKYYSA